MKTLVKIAFVGLCISAFLLMVSTSAVQAQVLAHSGDVAGYGGYGYVGNLGVSSNEPLFGASGGYNVTPSITVLGEYTYQMLGSE